MGQRILVIEDDPATGSLLSDLLAGSSTEVELHRHGANGLQRALSGHWHLFVIDWKLPHIDGLEICRSIRLRDRTTPMILLTAKDTEADRVAGLDAGADDYIAKPFRLAELKARVRAQLRRSTHGVDRAPDNLSALRIGSVLVDPATRRVQRHGVELSLTAREFQLLYFLMQHAHRAWTREQLLLKLWGPEFDGYSHTVNSHINRLRLKIEAEPSCPRLITTVWGEGYRFAAESEN
jgi:DNA-binding response OmpR family regulator